MGSFSYTSRVCFIFLLHFFFFFFFFFFLLALISSGEFLLLVPCLLHFLWGVSLTHPMPAPPPLPPPSGEFLLHSPCWLHFYWGSFSYVTHPVLALLLPPPPPPHPPTFFFFFFFSFFCLGSFSYGCRPHFYLGSFSYTSHACFIFLWGVSLTRPMLASYTFIIIFFLLFLIWGISLPHPMLPSFLSGEFLLHIPCCLEFYARSFCYTSRFFLFFFIW